MVPSWRDQARGNSGSRDDRLTFSCQCHLGEQLPDQGEHCSTRFGARTGRFEAGFGQSQGWRRPKCRLRRSVRPVGRDEGPREAGGLPGEKTFGVICQ
ncbi:hypothetical protein B224_3061 [Aeromonas media WS]|nr:hypothetical protein B224_3061 [Aeromonas media WS]